MLEKSLFTTPSEAVSDQSYSEVHMAQGTSLQPGQSRHLLRATATTSRHPERDILVLLLGLTAGMRVTEIAQIEGKTCCSLLVRFAKKLVCARRSLNDAGNAAFI
jgi:hypothetical protein